MTGTSSQQQNTQYNVSPTQVESAVRNGGDFVLITKSSTGSGFKIWSSTDQRQTEQLFQTAMNQISTPVTS